MFLTSVVNLGEAMGDFSNLEDRMGPNVRELHNYLWTPGWKGDEEALRGALRTDAGELDAFLAAEGDLARNAEALTEDWGRNRSGEMLFELLDHTYRLTAATELLKRGEYAAAATQANQAAESVSIGICANAGCFPLVEQWEGGEITFTKYARELVKALGEKGLSPSEGLQRQLMAVHGLAKNWDASASSKLQEMGARAAIEGALWVAVAGVQLREGLDAAPKTPYGAMPGLFVRIAHRL
ncbi:MAG: hypothetical protein ACE5EW_00945 [Thermoplasmata archaeon]